MWARAEAASMQSILSWNGTDMKCIRPIYRRPSNGIDSFAVKTWKQSIHYTVDVLA